MMGIRPVITEDGIAYLIGDDGCVIDGVRSFTINVHMDSPLTLENVEIMATKSGAPSMPMRKDGGYRSYGGRNSNGDSA